MSTGELLALDLASAFGWAQGSIGAELCDFGSGRFAPEGAPSQRVFGGCSAWITARLRDRPPAAVCFEAPVPPIFVRGKTTVATTRIAYGLAGIVEAACDLAGIEVREAAPDDVRRFFIGMRAAKDGPAHNKLAIAGKVPSKAQLSKARRADTKNAVGDRCRLLGYEPEDDDQSDAIALWHYFGATRSRAAAIQSTPLFGRRT